MSNEGLLGYIVGRLEETLKATRVDQDTANSSISCYLMQLQRVCTDIVRLCKEQLETNAKGGNQQ